MDVGIVAFAFGTPSSILSNQRLAGIAKTKARSARVAIYTQRDINLDTDGEVEYTDEEAGQPPPTLRIARGAVKWATGKGIRKLWVVAARPHMWRAIRDLKMAVKEAGALIDVCASWEIENYPEDSWFCPDSTQKWVSSAKEWQKREFILRLMPFWIYSKVAS